MFASFVNGECKTADSLMRRRRGQVCYDDELRETCRNILGGDIFEDCHEKVSYEDYMDACVAAACNCDQQNLLTCDKLCSVFSDFSRECTKNMGTENCIYWRNEQLCPLMCETKNDERYDCVWHYECCGNQIPTFSNRFPNETMQCEEGCFPHCEDGYLYSHEKNACLPLIDSTIVPTSDYEITARMFELNVKIKM
jgi:hypothetical protein